MRLSVNGQAREVPDGLTVGGLLQYLREFPELGLGTGPVAVERNREVVPRAAHGTTPLATGDELEIVHFVGGG